MAEGVEIGTAWVKIAASARGITKDVEKELGPAGEAGGKAFGAGFDKGSKESGGMLDVFERNSTKLLLAATAAGGALFGLASAAGSLNAALQTSDRVFGDASSSVQAFAADTSDAVFLSETAALQAANSFGIFGAQAGMGADEAAAFSIRMVQMAADLAAVADVPVEQAILDMRSAFAGSTETMQKYGINLNETELKAVYFAETGERITGVMTAQQKTMAVHWALLEKGAFAFGAAESEADQFAAQVDKLKGTVGDMAADFGKPVVDFASGLLGEVSGGLQALLDFNDATGGMLATGVAASLGLAAAASGAAGLIGKVTEIGKKMRGPTGALTTFGKFGLAAGAVGLALTAGFTIYGLATSHSRELAEQSQRASAGMTDAALAAWEYADAAAAAGESVSGLAIANSTLGLAVLDAFAEIDAETLGRFNVSAKDLGDTLLWLERDPVSAMRSLGEEAGLTEKEAGALAMAIAVYGSTSDDLATSSNNLGYNLSQVRGEFGLTQEEAFALAARLGASGLAGDMEDLWDAANTKEFDKYAASMLNAAVTSSDWSKETITGIEAANGLSRETGDAVQILALYYEALALLTPEQRDAALSGTDLADGIDDAADAASSFDRVAADTIDTMSDAAKAFEEAADQASAFDTALRRMTDPVFNYTEAVRDQIEAREDLQTILEKSKKSEIGYAGAVSVTTEAGRKNYDAVVAQRNAILDLVQANIENGGTLEQVEGQYSMLYDQLLNQVTVLLGNRDAAEEFLATLGMTPDVVTTTIGLVGQEEAKAQVEEILGKLDEARNAEIKPAIQPWIDKGQYDRALALLNALAKPISPRVTPITTGGSVRFVPSAAVSAYGNRFEGGDPQLSWVGDAPWLEHVVTTGNLPNFRRQVQEDNDLRSAVLNVASDYVQPVGFDSGGSGGVTINGGINVGSRQDLPSVRDELEAIAFRARFGLAGVG